MPKKRKYDHKLNKLVEITEPETENEKENPRELVLNKQDVYEAEAHGNFYQIKAMGLPHDVCCGWLEYGIKQGDFKKKSTVYKYFTANDCFKNEKF